MRAAETPGAFLFGAASQRRISQATILNGTAAGFSQPLVLLDRSALYGLFAAGVAWRVG
jgi:hypothetical protein